MPPGSLIKPVVIIVKENHTLDNYFGQFPSVEGDTTLELSGEFPEHMSSTRFS